MFLLIILSLFYTVAYVLHQLMSKQPVSIFMVGVFMFLTLAVIVSFIRLYIPLKKKEISLRKDLLDTRSNQILRDILELTFRKDTVSKSSQEIINVLKKYYDIDHCTILISSPRNTLNVSATTIPKEHIKEIEKYSINMLEISKDQGSNAIIQSSNRFLEYPTASNRRIQYMYYIPLSLGETMIGSLLIENRSNESLKAVENNFFKDVINNISITLQNLIYYEHERAAAMIDGLTQVYNRNFMQKDLLEELENHKKLNKKFSMTLFDIDHFKKFNDTYGHLFGDVVLQQTAQFMKSNIRETEDKIYRYGGEEFVLFFSDTDNDTIYNKVDQLREGLSQLILRNNEGVETRVTASFGLAEYPSDDLSIKGLLERADQALYNAKHNGRNQVKIYRSIKENQEAECTN